MCLFVIIMNFCSTTVSAWPGNTTRTHKYREYEEEREDGGLNLIACIFVVKGLSVVLHKLQSALRWKLLELAQNVCINGQV